MNEDDLEIFNDSLARCSGTGRFIDRFYERFFASSDEVRTKFRNVDMRRQRRMMGASLYAVMLAVDGRPEGMLHLERMAVVHGPGEHDIPAHLYDLWLACMLQAVEECDPKFSPEIDRVWRRMMQHGVDTMKSRAGGAAAKH